MIQNKLSLIDKYIWNKQYINRHLQHGQHSQYEHVCCLLFVCFCCSCKSNPFFQFDFVANETSLSSHSIMTKASIHSHLRMRILQWYTLSHWKSHNPLVFKWRKQKITLSIRCDIDKHKDVVLFSRFEHLSFDLRISKRLWLH